MYRRSLGFLRQNRPAPIDLIEVGLLAAGAGPTLDFADATTFLAGFETVIEKVRRRRLQ